MNSRQGNHATQRDGVSIKRASEASSQKSVQNPLTHPLVRLQRSIGNQVVNRIIQAKLTVNPPDDAYEREADRVAAEVVNRIGALGASAVQGQDIREEGEEDKLMMKPISHLRGGEGGVTVAPAVEASVEQARGWGHPLADDIRVPMERAFGVDFGGVRIHTDAQADRLSLSVQAEAFTKGLDIFFRAGRFEPDSRPGQRLLAHELTHVAQQTPERVRSTPLTQRAVIDDVRIGEEDGTKTRGEDVHLIEVWRPRVRCKDVDTRRVKWRNRTGGPACVTPQHGGVDPLGRSIQRFAPNQDEQDEVTAQLDKLLGPHADPVGIRAQITSAATSLIELRNAVTAVVDDAAVPQGDRVGLLNQFGNNVGELAKMLAEATLASGAGTPAVRLTRVLAATPANIPRTVAGLRPAITAQKAIDEKILRGSGGEIVGEPSGDDRTLIGGHSPRILSDLGFEIVKTEDLGNDMRRSTFYKLLRSDGGAMATAIRTKAPGNLVDSVRTIVEELKIAIDSVPPPPFANMPEARQAKERKWEEGRRSKFLMTYLIAINRVNPQKEAKSAAANPTQAPSVRPFTEVMQDMFSNAKSASAAAKVIDQGIGAAAEVALKQAETAFKSTGPVISTKKSFSTLAPLTWTEDDILRAGDQTAQVPPRLIRHDKWSNDPPSGTDVQTKHHAIIRGIVWVVIKDDVRFEWDGVNTPTFTGGRVSASFPLGAINIPPDPVLPNKDTDSFTKARGVV